MEKKFFGIIYKAAFPNGKYYIGQTTRGLAIRIRSHLRNLDNENVVFHNAIKKYGKDNVEWEILDSANDADELNEKEVYWIDFYKTYLHRPDSNGYNMTLGGGSTLGWIPSIETRKKIGNANRERMMGSNNHQYGKRGELSTWFGRKHTEEEKKKISQSNKGKIMSQETREKISKSNTGKTKGIPKSEEHRKKISVGKIGHSVSEETRQKISETKKRRNNGN